MKRTVHIPPSVNLKLLAKAERLTKAFKTRITPEQVIERTIAYSLIHFKSIEPSAKSRRRRTGR